MADASDTPEVVVAADVGNRVLSAIDLYRSDSMVSSPAPLRSRVGALLVAVVLAVAACTSSTSSDGSGDGDETDRSTVTPSPRSDTELVGSVSVGELTEILVGGREEYLVLAEEPVGDGGRPLSNWYGESELAELEQRLEFLGDSGRAARIRDEGDERVAIESVEDNGDGRLNVIYCATSDVVVYEIETDDVIAEGPRLDRRFGLFEMIDGEWRIVDDVLMEAFDPAESQGEGVDVVPICPI